MFRQEFLLLKEMSEEEKFSCPSCGTFVSRDDVYCRKCGISFAGFSKPTPEIPPSTPEWVPEEVYTRKFPLTQRFYKLLTAPSEAMRDIALAPDYEGIFVVIAVEFILLSIGIVMVMQRIQFLGPNAGSISNLVSSVMVSVYFSV